MGECRLPQRSSKGSRDSAFHRAYAVQGDSRRTAQQIAKEIDALGGHLNAQTSKEYTIYYTKVLDEHLFKAADIVFDLFLNAEINPDELEKEKKVVLQEISMTEDTPDDYINDLFAEAFFRNTTLGDLNPWDC